MISVWTVVLVISALLFCFGISSLLICLILEGECWIAETMQRFILISIVPLALGIGMGIFLMIKYDYADIEKVTEFEISAEYDENSKEKVKFIVTLPNGETDEFKNNDTFTDISYIEKKTVLGKDFYDLYLTKYDYASICETLKIQTDTIKISN